MPSVDSHSLINTVLPLTSEQVPSNEAAKGDFHLSGALTFPASWGNTMEQDFINAVRSVEETRFIRTDGNSTEDYNPASFKHTESSMVLCSELDSVESPPLIQGSWAATVWLLTKTSIFISPKVFWFNYLLFYCKTDSLPLIKWKWALLWLV